MKWFDVSCQHSARPFSLIIQCVCLPKLDKARFVDVELYCALNRSNTSFSFIYIVSVTINIVSRQNPEPDCQTCNSGKKKHKETLCHYCYLSNLLLYLNNSVTFSDFPFPSRNGILRLSPRLQFVVLKLIYLQKAK